MLLYIYMSLERFIGYSGFLLIVFHTIPVSKSFVIIFSICVGVGLILSATYLRWKRKIELYIHSHKGHMSIPNFFNRLQQDSKQYNKKLNTEMDGDVSDTKNETT